jgi:hypothetical protein
MSHTTQVVKIEQVSDECICVKIRCCDDEKTDAVLTVYNVMNLTQEQIEAQIDKHHDRVAAKCAGMAKAKGHLQLVGNQTKVHN